MADALQAAANFSTKIGEGEFGVVYCGSFRGGKVAVKKLLPGAFQQSKVREEIMNSSFMRHPCLLPPLAYSRASDEEWCLVYEDMSNGSLRDNIQCIHNNPPLHYSMRVRMAMDIALMMRWYHEAHVAVSIYNLTSSNILLGDKWEIRIRDVGVSRGTKGLEGYNDPRLSEHPSYSPINDVFRFGIILLELLSGKPPSKPQSATLFGQLKTAILNPTELTAWLDNGAAWDPVCADGMAQIARKCLFDDNRATAKMLFEDLQRLYKTVSQPPADNRESDFEKERQNLLDQIHKLTEERQAMLEKQRKGALQPSEKDKLNFAQLEQFLKPFIEFQRGELACAELIDFEYDKAKHLGKGDFGTVKMPTACRPLPAVVALKALYNYREAQGSNSTKTDPESPSQDSDAQKEKFDREYKLLLNFPHWTLANVFNYFRADVVPALFPMNSVGMYHKKTTYFTMEAGTCDLQHWAKGNKISDELQALMFLLQILNGVEHIEGNGFAHMDLKMDNILLMPSRGKVEGELMLVLGDLGAAVPFQHSDVQIGNRVNRSPEVLRPLTALNITKNDVWACGCILYELLEGKHPFLEQHQQLEHCILHGAIPKLSAKWPLRLQYLQSRLLSREIEDRPTAKQATRIVALMIWGDALLQSLSEIQSSASNAECGGQICKTWLQEVRSREVEYCESRIPMKDSRSSQLTSLPLEHLLFIDFLCKVNAEELVQIAQYFEDEKVYLSEQMTESGPLSTSQA